MSTILLITPAAWHRLVERGELTERFHRFASAMVLAALAPLALGLGGDGLLRRFAGVRRLIGPCASLERGEAR